MQKIIFIIIVAILFFACNNNSNLVEPIPSGSYSYMSYDTTGTAIVKGWLIINDIDSSNIIGKWEFKSIGNALDIGPQVGSGELIGGTLEDGIWVELNPQFRDNNLQLIGILGNNKFSGVWQWTSIVGITNHGTFEALKN